MGCQKKRKEGKKVQETRGKRAKQKGRGHEERRRWALSLRQYQQPRQEVGVVVVSYLGEEEGGVESRAKP